MPAVAASSEFIARYAEMSAARDGMTPSLRGMQFNQFVADVLRWNGVDAEANLRGPRGEVDVAFTFEGPQYLLEAKWEAGPIGADPIRKLHSMIEERLPGSVGIVLSWSGFNDSAQRYAGSVRDVILLDRSHLEAMLTGVVSAREILSTAHRLMSVLGQEYTPLARMLRPRADDPKYPLVLGVPEGFTPEAVAAPDGLDAEIVLHGARLEGLANQAERQLVITTLGGLVDLDLGREDLRTRLELSGCVGSAYADTDGGLICSSRKPTPRSQPL